MNNNIEEGRKSVMEINFSFFIVFQWMNFFNSFMAQWPGRGLLFQHPELGNNLELILGARDDDDGNDNEDEELFFSGNDDSHYVETLCMKRVNAKMYNLMEKYETIDTCSQFNNSGHFITADDIAEFVRAHPNTVVKYVQIPGGTTGSTVRTVQCAEKDRTRLYVDNRFHGNLLQFIVQTENGNRIELLQQPPTVIWDVREPAMELLVHGKSERQDELEDAEEDFKLDHDLELRRKPHTNICRLDSIGRQRLCGAVHSVWEHNVSHSSFVNQYRRSELDECEKNVTMKFLTNPNIMYGLNEDIVEAIFGRGQQEEFQQSIQSIRYEPVDAVACSINTEWQHPNFYVTPVQNNDSAVFVLHRLDDEFIAVMQITDIPVLR